MQLSLDFNQIDDRSADSFNHALRINRPFGQLDPVIAWCKTNLHDDWRWQMVNLPNSQGPGDYIFYFDSEKDYFLFTCRWR